MPIFGIMDMVRPLQINPYRAKQKCSRRHLLEEQILSLKRLPQLRKEAETKMAELLPLKVYPFTLNIGIKMPDQLGIV